MGRKNMTKVEIVIIKNGVSGNDFMQLFLHFTHSLHDFQTRFGIRSSRVSDMRTYKVPQRKRNAAQEKTDPTFGSMLKQNTNRFQS